MATHWWSQRFDENLFMEITRRDDIGNELKAPITARGGVNTQATHLSARYRPMASSFTTTAKQSRSWASAARQVSG